MLPEPLVPLRWYEVWMLRLLSASPRIERIVVFQRAVAPKQPHPEPASPREGYLSYTEFLEAMYNAPSAEE